MPNELETRVHRAIQEKVFPGCVIGVVRDGEREVLPFGTFTYDAGAASVTPETIYDLASVTKSIPVASLVATFIAEGRIRAADAVRTYLPELQNDFGATVEDLLTYRVRGLRFSELRYRTFEEVRTHILEHGFDGPPGESTYTNLPAYLLGLILERVGGAILPALAHRYFFEPLSMHDTTFFPHDISRIPPTEIVQGGEVRGIVHDESARIFAHARHAVGHAGLFSTAPDILNFLEALLSGKLPAVMEAAQKGWGWQRAESWFMGGRFNPGSFGKTGFTGTSVACDPERRVGLVIFSNRTYPVRPADAASLHSAINRFRSDITDVVLH